MQYKFTKVDSDSNLNQVHAAINALNQLTEHHQKLENSKEDGDKVILKLASPWKQAQIFGGENYGIMGSLTFKSSSSSIFTHPLLTALIKMGFDLGSHNAISNTRSKSRLFVFKNVELSLYHYDLINQIPKRCSDIVNENKDHLNTSSSLSS